MVVQWYLGGCLEGARESECTGATTATQNGEQEQPLRSGRAERRVGVPRVFSIKQMGSSSSGSISRSIFVINLIIFWQYPVL